MKRPSSRQLDAITRLNHDKDFIIFLAWVKESRVAEAIESIDIPNEPQRSWAQGRVKQLSSLLDTIKDAERLLPLVRSDEQREGGQ